VHRRDEEALLRQLEHRLMQPDARRDAMVAEQLLGAGFVEIGASGRLYDRDQTLASLVHQPAVEYSADGFVFRWLSDSIVLVTYRTERAAGEGAAAQRCLRSSIWQHGADGWQMVFHQGTPT
jgi:hypothetical protein